MEQEEQRNDEDLEAYYFHKWKEYFRLQKVRF
jgi:hypothetical protein